MRRNSEFTSKNGNRRKTLKAFVSNPRFKHGSLATIITVCVIVLILLLNTAVTLIGNRVDLRFDITSNKIFSLTDEAQAYFNAVAEDVTITVLSSREDMESFSAFSDLGYDGTVYEAPIRRLPEILTEIGKNEHITVKYVDMDANPTYLNKYELVSVPDMPELYIMVESAKRYKLVELLSFINTDLNNTENYSTEKMTYYYFTEQPLINACAYVLSDDITTIAFVTGHGELAETDSNLAAFVSVFENNNISVTAFDMTTQAIPDDVDFIAVVSPSRDFSADEITKLDDFLQNGKNYGKNLLYFDGGSANLPNLYQYLELNWGIKIDPDTRVYDEDSCVTYPYLPIATYNEDSDICKTLAAEGIKTVLAYPQPIEILWTEKDIRTVTPLLTSSATSFSRAYTGESAEEDTAATVTKTDSDPVGPFNIMTVSQKRNLNQPVEEASNVLVSGDGFWVWYFSSSSSSTYGNVPLLTEILASMQVKSDPVTIIEKDLMTEVIQLSSKQIRTYAVVFSVFFPIAIVAVCVIVFVLRKNL